MTSIFRMAAAALAMSAAVPAQEFRIDMRPDDGLDVGYIPTGWTGNTQGSHRDVSHGRHLNRLARKARRQERLHRKH